MSMRLGELEGGSVKRECEISEALTVDFYCTSG